jgi:hypothetical protein
LGHIVWRKENTMAFSEQDRYLTDLQAFKCITLHTSFLESFNELQPPLPGFGQASWRPGSIVGGNAVDCRLLTPKGAVFAANFGMACTFRILVMAREVWK